MTPRSVRPHMTNLRNDVALSLGEAAVFLDEQRVIVLGTIGSDGLPHLAPMWFMVKGQSVAMWTYRSSQKAKNLYRDPRATLLVEAGDTYRELRGLAIDCRAEFVEDVSDIARLGHDLSRRYEDGTPPSTEADEIPSAIAAQASKRVGILFHPTRTRSWDHRKLGTARH
jgi:PPOX class probable F420-dependent enzyme